MDRDDQAHAKFARFPRIDFDDAQLSTSVDYLVKPLFYRGMNAEVYGPSGGGKTFFTIDMMLHIALGIPWRGRRVRQALVVYVASEAGSSILRRFVAWRNEKLGEAREGRTPFVIVTRGPNLLEVGDVDELLAQLRDIAEDFGLPLGAVAFDTLSRSAAGGDENSAQDMTKIIGAADRIRDELSSATMFVHHSGKDLSKGGRGHSSLFAACDLVVCVADGTATVEKSRDGVSGETFPFELSVIDLGVDQDGDAITTCVVKARAASSSNKRKEPAGRNQQLVWRTLQDVIAESGEIMPETSAIPNGVRAATFDALCAQAVPKFPGVPAWRAKDRISQALVSLQAARLVGVHGDYVWKW